MKEIENNIKEEAQKLLDLLNIQATVNVGIEDDVYKVEIDAGEENAFLIGKHGNTLSAFELILKMIIAQKSGDYKQITIEIGNYRMEREEYLKGLDTFAGKVIRTIDEHGESLGGNNRKGINFDNEGFHYKIELENQFRGYKAQLRLNEDLLKGCELTVKETGLECIDGLQQEVTNYVSIQLSTNKVQFAILTNPIEFYMPDRSEVEELNTVAIQQELTVRLTDNQSAEIRSIVVVQKALGLLLRKYEVSSNK